MSTPRTDDPTSLSHRVLCIVGDSRSGSTLLQQLLGAQPRVSVVGELRRLNEFVEADGACSCGEPVSECAWWRGVLEEADIGEVMACGPHGRLSRLAQFASLLGLGRPGGRALLAADQRGQVSRAVARRTGAEIVVDSSKEPAYAMLLARQSRIPVEPVFLFRDPRGVAWSQVRRGVHPLHAAVHTAGLARLMHIMSRFWRGPRHIVYYEALCRDPRPVLAGLCGREPSEIRLDLPTPQHFIGGSAGFPIGRPVDIRLDRDWRDEAPPRVRRVIDAIGGPVGRRLGYA